jgi:hypothetical protein
MLTLQTCHPYNKIHHQSYIVSLFCRWFWMTVFSKKMERLGLEPWDVKIRVQSMWKWRGIKETPFPHQNLVDPNSRKHSTQFWKTGIQTSCPIYNPKARSHWSGVWTPWFWGVDRNVKIHPWSYFQKTCGWIWDVNACSWRNWPSINHGWFFL